MNNGSKTIKIPLVLTSQVEKSITPGEIEKKRATPYLKLKLGHIFPARIYAVNIEKIPIIMQYSKMIISISIDVNWCIPDNIKGTALAYE